MRHIVHHDNYDVAILVKDSALNQAQIEEYYIKPSGLKAVSFTLDYAGKKKPSAKDKMDYLTRLLPILDERGIHDLLVTDGEYFKTLAKVQKSEPHYGYILPCKLKGYEHFNVCLSANYQAAIFNPAIGDKIRLSLKTMLDHKEGAYQEIGTDIIHSEAYPNDYLSILHMLNSLHAYDAVTADIEAFSLKHYTAGIGSIAFAWDEHNGFAFTIDYRACEPYQIEVWDKKDKKFKTKTAVAEEVYNPKIRELLKQFFEEYKGKIIWHNASFDCYILVYQLWMNDLLDQDGLLRGLEIMHSKMECTKLITYLATNSTAGNKLGLKDQAHEFAGNYAESEISNILLIPEEQLLRYNLVDTLATWYVMDKHYHTMVLDNQLEIYETIFKPAVKDIIQMQLTGMCLDMEKVIQAETTMVDIYEEHLDALRSNPIIVEFVEKLRWEQVAIDNLSLKNKQREYTDACIQKIVFNPNSGTQLQKLIYETLDFPILDRTKNKQPATGKKPIKKLLKLSMDTEKNEILEHIIAITDVNKILTSFIPAMKAAPMASDGYYYLFGNFNLGGTVSGRLSSNNPKYHWAS